jgi:glycine cleavage system H protein
MASYPAGYKYTKDHEWIELAGDRGKVGITDYAQQQLGDVVYLELPEVYAPVTGEIVEVNSGLKDKPESVNADPHSSWMVVVRLTNPGEAGALLDATQYQDLIK